MPEPLAGPDFGPNDGLVEDLYQQYLDNPTALPAKWRAYFDTHQAPHQTPPETPNQPTQPNNPQPTPQPAEPTTTEASGGPYGRGPQAKPGEGTREGQAPTPDPTESRVAPAESTDGEVATPEPLRGAAARIVKNMESSLEVPTATSFRNVPAKLLEVNRSVINGYLSRNQRGKVSFTHLIGYAVARALVEVPAMNAAYVEIDGKPGIVRHPHVGLGLAVDVTKSDGTHSLLVPCIKGADTVDFKGFLAEYEALIAKVRSNAIGVDDFTGVTATLTNPGTIGTVQSVPRLMPGQGVIVGVGSIAYPAEYEGADASALAELGVSKVVTLTSTYDHRIIQGAESGLFLKRIHDLLLGADEFYDEVFAALGVPYQSVQWRKDISPLDRETVLLQKQQQVDAVMNMYRVRGHLIADLDPLRVRPVEAHTELDPATYGLSIWDLDREFLTGGLAGIDRMPLGEILHVLRDAYCRSIGVEYMHIQDPEQKRWIQEQVEGVTPDVSADDKHHILDRLNAAEAFERFLGTKYVGAKRFSLEGAESAIALLDAILESAADGGIVDVVLGMAHRGRLNVLANIVGKSYEQIFREFEGMLDEDTVQGSGDVKYHLGARGTFVSRAGHTLPVELAANPSHLEAVDPVVEGMVRAKQDHINDPAAFSVLPVLVHGDAAFAGQGVVAETLNLSDLKGYRVGGTVHLVINNQVGFTTSPEHGRSSVYATDVAKMVQAPILHVNGDDPEACVRVARLAFSYRQTFHRDVVIDMVCYRRHGHNEADDPSYTQPLMYRRIASRPSVRELYVDTLVRRSDISVSQAEQAVLDFSHRLQRALDETRSLESVPPSPRVVASVVSTRVDTAVARSTLDYVFGALASVPEGFTVHPRLARQFAARTTTWESGQLDWATAEALAFGTVLLEGTNIRLAGQDSRRGTFSQRHCVLVDHDNGAEHVPLTALTAQQGHFRVYDSLLSEYAGLGFEYGYSVVDRRGLVLWEAQFGDFVNGAQIIVDQFLASAEDKWGQSSGLVLLLPHGYDGQGPEHSSARIERFLTLCAGGNIQVVNATTPAQYFHLLRRQVLAETRRPLVVATPKYLLRAREARSAIDDLTTGTFEELLDDPGPPEADRVKRLLLCSGKVGYELLRRRDEIDARAAVLRVEQLYPFPNEAIVAAIERYPKLKTVTWVQEEPENMGAWPFVHGALHRILPDRVNLKHVSRDEAASPATGSAAVHGMEQLELVDRAFAGL